MMPMPSLVERAAAVEANGSRPMASRISPIAPTMTATIAVPRATVVGPGLADAEARGGHEAGDGEDDDERQDRDQVAEQEGIGRVDRHPGIDEELRDHDRERCHADDETRRR